MRVKRVTTALPLTAPGFSAFHRKRGLCPRVTRTSGFRTSPGLVPRALRLFRVRLRPEYLERHHFPPEVQAQIILLWTLAWHRITARTHLDLTTARRTVPRWPVFEPSCLRVSQLQPCHPIGLWRHRPQPETTHRTRTLDLIHTFTSVLIMMSLSPPLTRVDDAPDSSPVPRYI